jgi:putative transposase
MNTYKRHRFPPDIISHAVWLYYRFNLSYRDIEDLLKAWHPGPAPIQPAGHDPPWPTGENLPLTYHPVPDIA